MIYMCLWLSWWLVIPVLTTAAEDNPATATALHVSADVAHLALSSLNGEEQI